MKDTPLNLEQRDSVGGERAKRLRKTGYIPAVIYGKGMETIPVQMKSTDFRDFVMKNGKSSVFTTEFAQEQDFTLLVKDIKYDMLKKSVSHVDFQKVSPNEKVHAHIPIRIVGEDKVKKDGAVLVHQLHSVAVECFPQDIPHFVDADVSALASGNSLTVAQLRLPAGVTLVSEPNSVVLAVTGGKLDLDAHTDVIKPPAELSMAERNGESKEH